MELFAGVGGFRLGLEGVTIPTGKAFDVVWSNQWEPSTRLQHASNIYVERFGAHNHSNDDIATVPASELPAHEVMVGGFPCQDYSVARTLNQSEGLKGKKGVLWWEIHRLLSELGDDRPKYLILENVERLIKSPAAQRGRDFAVMLASLLDLGYMVEWRVLNAADYGMPQRRKRVFIVAYLSSTQIADFANASVESDWLERFGVVGNAFPGSATPSAASWFPLEGDLADITDRFNSGSKKTPFNNAGLARWYGQKRIVTTMNVDPQYSGRYSSLGDVLVDEDDVAYEYFIDASEIEKWRYLKGAKSVKRVSKETRHEYCYQEGNMAFPDDLEKPSRTIVTGEGGRTPSRFKHVVRVPSGRFRRLTPIELERLNMFPDNHTHGASDAKRAFFMGNALVVGVVSGLGQSLSAHHRGDVQRLHVTPAVAQEPLFHPFNS